MLRDCGTCVVTRSVNTQTAGGMPSYSDTEVCRGYYGEKTVGINRFYTAKAHNDQADLLIEIARNGGIRATDTATLTSFTDDGVTGEYKIIQVQHIIDDDGLPATDLTLERLMP